MRRHSERHLVDGSAVEGRVLGANDGILSTSSLIIVVAAAAAEPRNILIAGVGPGRRGPCPWQPANMSR